MCLLSNNNSLVSLSGMGKNEQWGKGAWHGEGHWGRYHQPGKVPRIDRRRMIGRIQTGRGRRHGVQLPGMNTGRQAGRELGSPRRRSSNYLGHSAVVAEGELPAQQQQHTEPKGSSRGEGERWHSLEMFSSAVTNNK